jgi:hypothetical protein
VFGVIVTTRQQFADNEPPIVFLEAEAERQLISPTVRRLSGLAIVPQQVRAGVILPTNLSGGLAPEQSRHGEKAAILFTIASVFLK